jgi:hypothetical protein
MSHGRIVILDIALRNAWHGVSTLRNGLFSHAQWWNMRDVELMQRELNFN